MLLRYKKSVICESFIEFVFIYMLLLIKQSCWENDQFNYILQLFLAFNNYLKKIQIYYFIVKLYFQSLGNLASFYHFK